MIFTLGVCAFAISSAINAQNIETDTFPTTYTNLKEVVVSSNKGNEKAEDISSQINIVKRRNIQTLMPQTTGDALIQNGTVFVQKSQMGGGSPTIRGFEANKVLLVVDGIRMNNAIYRGGHLQNIITVDPNALERIEVFNGPGSVIYGSDALGGVIHMQTISPQLSKNDSYSMASSAFVRTSTANKETTLHGDFNYGKQKWASLTSFTFSTFGDLQMGKNNGFFKNDSAYGNKTFFATRLNDNDTMLSNTKPTEQLFTGYSQIDLLQKILIKQSEKVNHLFNLQYSKSSIVPRYDRLTETSGNLPKFSEWYYGPQQRALLAYQLQLNKGKFYDNANITAAYQNIAESRYSRRFKNNNLGANEENVQVISLNADLSKELKNNHELRYGAEYVYNKVKSIGYNENIVTGDKTDAVTRYPNGSLYSTAGLYLTDRWEIKEDLILTVGGRISTFNLQAKFDDTYFNFSDLEVKQNSTSANGHIGLVMKPTKKLRIIAQMSTGFRNPNIDDMSKTFEQTSNSLVLPNTALKPEQVFSQEIGLDYFFGKRSWIDFRAYNTDYTDAIVVKESQYNGNDSVFYNGQNMRVLRAVNIAKANIYGFSSSVNLRFKKYWSAKASFNYTYGRDRTNENNILPLDHIPPVFANLFVGFEKPKWSVIASVLYNGKKDIKDYSNSGEDNLQYAPTYGIPAWYTINLKGSYIYNYKWVFRAGVENIMDMNYRYFASGISAAGRNVVLSAGFKF